MSRSKSRRSKAILRISVLSLVILAMAYSGASFYAGWYAKKTLDEQIQMQPVESVIQLRVIEHNRGIWQSSGTLALQTQTSEAQRDSSGEPAALVVQYQINHALMPSSMARVDWRTHPNAALTHQLEGKVSLLNDLSGQGTLDWQGQFDTSLAMPGATMFVDDRRIEVSAMTGQMKVGQRDFQLQMNWPFIDGQDSRSDFKVKGLQVDVDATDRVKGDIRNKFHMASVQWQSLKAHGVTLTGQATHSDLNPQATDHSPRLNLELLAEMQALEVSGYGLQGVVVDGVLRDLSIKPVQALQHIWNATLGLQHITADQWQKWRLAMRALVLDGLGVEIKELSTQSGFGKTLGHASFELQSVPESTRGKQSQPIDFKKYVSSRGVLEIQNEGKLTALTAIGTLMGILVKTPEGVSASYDLSNEGFELNGKQLPALPVRAVINKILNGIVVIDEDTPDAEDSEEKSDKNDVATSFKIDHS